MYTVYFNKCLAIRALTQLCLNKLYFDIRFQFKKISLIAAWLGSLSDTQRFAVMFMIIASAVTPSTCWRKRNIYFYSNQHECGCKGFFAAAGKANSIGPSQVKRSYVENMRSHHCTTRLTLDAVLETSPGGTTQAALKDKRLNITATNTFIKVWMSTASINVYCEYKRILALQ